MWVKPSPGILCFRWKRLCHKMWGHTKYILSIVTCILLYHTIPGLGLYRLDLRQKGWCLANRVGWKVMLFWSMPTTQHKVWGEVIESVYNRDYAIYTFFTSPILCSLVSEYSCGYECDLIIMRSVTKCSIIIFINSLCPHYALWHHRIWSTLVPRCLTAPSCYRNQCWLIIPEVLMHSPESNFTGTAQDIYPRYEF